MKETAPKTLYHPTGAEKAASFLQGLRMRCFLQRMLMAEEEFSMFISCTHAPSRSHSHA
jgi:hypothetical protein